MISEPTLCAVCKAHAVDGHGYGLMRDKRHIHACTDPDCIQLLPKVYAMNKEQLDAYEMKAVRTGGAIAGSYLDEIEKFSLEQLDPEEWDEFCKRMWTGARDELQRLIRDGEAPF
jgi:hypothetical protein